MIRIVEHEHHCTIDGDDDDILDVLQDVLTQVRDKEKACLILYRADSNGFTFPAGLLKFVMSELPKFNIPFEVKRIDRLPITKIRDDLLIDGPEPITLRDYQVTSIRKAVSHRRGIFNIATGGGKTEIIIGIAKMMGTSLTIVPSKSSLLQTVRRFRNRGLESVGGFGGGLKDLTQDHTIATAAMFNSRLKKKHKDTERFLRDAPLLMFDEVHHLGTAPTWQRVGDACGAERRYGFSGSPWASGMPTIDLGTDKESNYADFRVVSQVGEALVYIPSKMLRDMGVIIDPRIFVLPVSLPKGLRSNPFPRWNWVYKHGIVENESRNKLIVDSALRLHERGHRTTILVVSIAHGRALLRQLYDMGLNAAFTKGDDEVLVFTGKKIQSQKDAGERVRDAFLAGDIDVLIGSVVIDEAVDLPGMSALILAGGMKSPIRAVQRVGRAIRTADGKDEAIIIDFRDRQHYFLNNHTNKRLGIYAAHEYDYIECETADEIWEQV